MNKLFETCRKMIFIAMACCVLSSAYAAGPCAEDAKKFCPGMQPGDGQLAKCMAANHNALSGACQARQQAAKDYMKRLVEACKGDMQKFCSGVKPGQGALRNCLKKNQASLSSACRSGMKPN